MKKIVVLFLFLIITLSTAGCENFDKDKVLDKYDRILNKLGDESLTKDNKLIGDREFGEDYYVGTYSVQYDSFTGEEIIFGGTGLSRDSKEFTLKYKGVVGEGEFKIILISGSDEEIITNKTEEATYTYDFQQSDLYIKIVGEGFSGNVELEVTDN